MTPETARPFIDIAEPVARALADGRPVVALESTIITHGMPFPQNAEMAAAVEQIILDGGAVPATIAVVDGRLKVGLSAPERDALAQVSGAMKLSRADLAFAVAERRTGGTTVAATMIVAALAGIKVFATGGIGGVHKGAEKSFDISADLDELARTPVIVVSAGAKAILDIEKTLEVLETRGVPVVAYRSDVMPAFWSRNSRFKAPLRTRRGGRHRPLLQDAARPRPGWRAARRQSGRGRGRDSRRDDGGSYRRRAGGGRTAASERQGCDAIPALEDP